VIPSAEYQRETMDYSVQSVTRADWLAGTPLVAGRLHCQLVPNLGVDVLLKKKHNGTVTCIGNTDIPVGIQSVPAYTVSIFGCLLMKDEIPRSKRLSLVMAAVKDGTVRGSIYVLKTPPIFSHDKYT
jgi:hypothetical protein